MEIKKYWVPCPICGAKMIQCREDTILVRFPAYCKRCKKEYLITREPRAN